MKKLIFIITLIGVGILSSCNFIDPETYNDDLFEPDNTSLTANSIELGTNYNLTLSDNSDIDWFEISLQGDEVYAFHAEGTVTELAVVQADTKVTLYQYGSDSWTADYGYDSLITTALKGISNTTITYKFTVSKPLIGDPGYYTLIVTNVDNWNYPRLLQTNSTFVASLNVVGDVDWYRFDLLTGIYTISTFMEDTANTDVKLELFDYITKTSIGGPVYTNGVNENIVITNTTSGSILLKVSGSTGIETGTYVVKAVKN